MQMLFTNKKNVARPLEISVVVCEDEACDGAANEYLSGHEIVTNDSKYAYEMGRIAGGDLVDSFTGFEDTRYSSADVYPNRINPAKTK